MELTAGIIGVILTYIFSGNIVFSQSMNLCPFLGVSKKMNSAVAMGLAVTFVNTLVAAVCFGLYKLLSLYDLEYLKIITFVLVMVVIVQGLDIVLKKFSPSLYNALGAFLPLLTADCAIFFTVNTMINKDFFIIDPGWQGLLFTVFYALAIGVGFLLALVLMAGVRSKNDELAAVPKPFRGFPIALITAGLMALVFAGLTFG